MDKAADFNQEFKEKVCMLTPRNVELVNNTLDTLLFAQNSMRTQKEQDEADSRGTNETDTKHS